MVGLTCALFLVGVKAGVAACFDLVAVLVEAMVNRREQVMSGREWGQVWANESENECRKRVWVNESGDECRERARVDWREGGKMVRV